MRKMKYGIEIEFFGKEFDSVLLALNNAGISVSVNEVNNTWCLKHDSTVDYEGLEISSPILYEENLPIVKKVLDTLKEIGCKVNKSCGIHIHHDINDFTANNLKSLIYYYYNNQEIINSLMPTERLDCKWCQAFKENELLRLEAYDSIIELGYNFSGKYKAINTHAFVKYGTIEFRQHHGCLDSEDVLNWIELTFKMVCFAKEHYIFKQIKTKDNFSEFKKELDISATLNDFLNKKVNNILTA